MSESETLTASTHSLSGSPVQIRRGRKRLFATSGHCKSRRRNNSSHLSHSPTTDNSAIVESDDDFGQFVARELKLIKSVRAKQFAKLQIHSILFNAQFDVVSTPPDVIRSLMESHQSLHSCALSSALNSDLADT